MGHKNKSQWLDNGEDALWDACKSVDGKGFYLFSQRIIK